MDIQESLPEADITPPEAEPKPKRKPATHKKKSTSKKGASKSRKKKKAPPPGYLQRKLAMIAIELISLASVAISVIIVLLGYSADRFTGTRFFTNLLPFAFGVLLLVLMAVFFVLGWWRLRQWLHLKSEFLTPLIAASLAIIIGWFSVQDNFALAYGQFRTLVGGKEEAGRVTLSHQVYAAYRRYGAKDLQKMLDRSKEFTPAIEAAAAAFDVDVNILHGIAAAESSFLPRDSADGGRGLFQITQVPKAIIKEASKRLEIDKLDLQNPKHNAFVAAATFKHYLAEMNEDLFLALLAYNIGPANGGLRFIMNQYHASDFTTIQPYLQEMPRGYPVRVLSYSLAFRLWREEGKLLAYEEGRNALHIQNIGIPGLNGNL
ncbi:transglycosylase SLT domain-containing protein [Methylomicrobium sp. Wu6]|uniref:transglycosylase SLT domain-containing protein n=1 Tax=Methylomicrobium sp. Wu6 TaxID=3107928 RepID=UPI002DD63596|nr:transglycosylase SLT domain-containing protein [Methylomicrobium sp. Wu6]MEC4750591.1 transglycosylase SLT domain-containing protein [Methylomicrobium sp. Wu6]